MDTAKAIAALSQNEPIDWLFGRVLRAAAARGKSYFLLDALAGKNPHAVKAWNAWIAEFRSVLRNPDVAAKKSDAELSTSPAERIGDFMAEVLAVLHLSRTGYTDFECVLAGSNARAVDFLASREGKRVRIDVKNLHEPEDIIRTVALERWQECRAKHPEKYNISVLLSHSHIGSLSLAAVSRLKTAIDQLPGFASDEYKLVLDGDIPVTIKRLSETARNAPGPEGEMLRHMTDERKQPRLIIQSGIRVEHLEFNLPELQDVFIKAFRIVSDATLKFFGRQSDPDAENVIVLRWQAPNVFYHDATPQMVQKAIEDAFAAVDLQLTVLVLGSDPEPDFKFAV